MSSSETDTPVQLVVDVDRCIGSGMCEMLEEATFLIDEDTNIAGTIGEATLPDDRAAVVIDRCPAGAISVVELSDADTSEYPS